MIGRQISHLARLTGRASKNCWTRRGDRPRDRWVYSLNAAERSAVIDRNRPSVWHRPSRLLTTLVTFGPFDATCTLVSSQICGGSRDATASDDTPQDATVATCRPVILLASLTGVNPFGGDAHTTSSYRIPGVDMGGDDRPSRVGRGVESRTKIRQPRSSGPVVMMEQLTTRSIDTVGRWVDLLRHRHGWISAGYSSARSSAIERHPQIRSF